MKLYAIFDEYGDHWPETTADTEHAAIALGLSLVKRADPRSHIRHPLPPIPFDSWRQMQEHGLMVREVKDKAIASTQEAGR